MDQGDRSSTAPSTLTSGAKVFGRYQIVRCISSGGMGAVYEVVHAETKRRCALKVMLPTIVSNPELRARFQLEATVTADIHSEHIVELFDAGVDGESGSPFIVMELLRGEDLQSMVFRRGSLPAPEVTLLLYQAALALERTHSAGIVHRDLKPENLFVTTRDDGSPRLKIFDFGIAKVVAGSAHMSKATQGMGTPMYMAPEQRGGEGAIGPPADTHALGHIAYALLVGEPYWEEEAEISPTVYAFLMKMAAGITEPPTARAKRRRDKDLPPAFDEWMMKATAIKPEERFQRASELVAALARALDQPVPTLATSSIIIPVEPPSRVDVSPHADTIATDPDLPKVPARSTPDIGPALVPPAKAPLAEGQAPAKRPSTGLKAVIGGVAFGLVVAGVLGWFVIKPSEPPSEPPTAAPSSDTRARPPDPTPSAGAINSAVMSAVPSVTPAPTLPAASAEPSASPSVSASATAKSAPAGTGARPTTTPTTSSSATPKATGNTTTKPLDPLDVR